MERPAPSHETSRSNLDKFLKDRFGPDCRVLIHVDEHFKMVDRVRRPHESAQFSRGGLEVVASLSSARAVATYTQQPFEVPTESS